MESLHKMKPARPELISASESAQVDGNAPAFVEASKIEKEFRNGEMVVRVLRGINLRIYRGEYLSIVGPSGSGKTTLFNLLGALDVPTTGSVTIAGIQLLDLTPRQLAGFRSHYVGYIFQTYNLLPAYNALENVALPMLLCGTDRAESLSRASDLLKGVGLGHREKHRPGEMSGGQQQRVAIARALANNPRLILADEPTANLDLKTGAEIIQLLCNLCKERNATVIAATHDHQMLSVSDRIVWLKDGEIEKILTGAEAVIHVGSISTG